MKTQHWMWAAWFAAAGMSTGCTDNAAVQKATSEAQSMGGSDMVAGDELVHPAWSVNATIYEVNLRQHTPEGTIAAFEPDLERLKALGVDILWFMPIHPIGEVNRKGGENADNFIVEPGSSSLGSPYSVKDYLAVNPDYGTFEDFKRMVDKAHGLGMRVILDWVANHTAFDSKWTEDHREFFLLDSAGKLQPPTGTDWWDVTQLDWDKGRENGLYQAMEEALDFWVREADIDGYRCDVAGKVPTAFWEQARRSLEAIKPDVFMLAEAEEPEHHNRAFDMSYAWHLHHVYNEVARRDYPLDSIRVYLDHELERFGRDAYRMSFVTNHDENSWNGTIAERMGANADAMTVLAGTLIGMPLIYSGQEAGLDKRLRFFEKDTIAWGNVRRTEFYRTLNALNHDEEALWNGAAGGWPTEIATAHPEDVYAFRRAQGESEVIVAINLGEASHAVNLPVDPAQHALQMSDEASVLDGEMELAPHGYAVWTARATEQP